MALRCQCCGFAVSALLKECESLKEKELFCFTISAAEKAFFAGNPARGVFPFWSRSHVAVSNHGMARMYDHGHLTCVSLTPRAAGSILIPDAADA